MSCLPKTWQHLCVCFIASSCEGLTLFGLLTESGPGLCVTIVNHVCINVSAETERHLAQSWSKCMKCLKDGGCERRDRLTGNTSIGSSAPSGGSEIVLIVALLHCWDNNNKVITSASELSPSISASQPDITLWDWGSAQSHRNIFVMAILTWILLRAHHIDHVSLLRYCSILKSTQVQCPSTGEGGVPQNLCWLQ